MQRLLLGKLESVSCSVTNGILIRLIMALWQHSVAKMQMDCLHIVFYLQSMPCHLMVPNSWYWIVIGEN